MTVTGVNWQNKQLILKIISICLPKNSICVLLWRGKRSFAYQTMLTRVLYVRANCMCKLGCFKHSANEIFNLLHYVLIKPQFKCNWKTISSLYENYALQKFVVFYLFDFLKLLIILIITLIWQCHVVSQTLLTVDLDPFDYWFYRPL